MNLQNQRPVFVPNLYQAEIEKLSKAALMDMVWDFATRCAGIEPARDIEIMDEVRKTAEIITTYRKQARARAS